MGLLVPLASKTVLRRKQSYINVCLREVSLCASQRATVDFKFAAKAVVLDALGPGALTLELGLLLDQIGVAGALVFGLCAG